MDHILTLSFPVKECSALPRLERMRKRDSDIIYRYLGIIKQETTKLVSSGKSKKYIIDRSELDLLTLTTRNRKVVQYDLKASFPRISHDEMQECRDTAIGIYKSYLELQKIQKNARLPVDKPVSKRGIIPRTIKYNGGARGRFELDLDQSVFILRDSLDSNWAIVNGNKLKVAHDKLIVPVTQSVYHLKELEDSKIASINISERDNRYFVNLSIKRDVEELSLTGKAKAVMGIDLGYNKTAYTVVMTSTGIQCRNTWHCDDKFRILKELEEQIASLQREHYNRINNNLPKGNVYRKLKELKNKRKIISLEYDRILVKQLAEHIQDLSNEFDMTIGIGKLKGIRNRGRKGNGKGKKFRKMLHSWSFYRFTKLLIHKLEELGLKKILYDVNESWTSIMCYRCNTKGKRPSQSYFICTNPVCGVKNNADFNGAMNIAKRVVKKLKLIPDKFWGISGLGRYLRKVTPKARSKTRKRRGSGRSDTAKGVKETPVSVCVVAEDTISTENDPAMLKKYGNPISADVLDRIKRSGMMQSPS
jgi:IS605 OrfB family transposase